MLSILIPVYNQSVVKLVGQLAGQAALLATEIEIVCLDDGSEYHWKKTNKQLVQYKICRYAELPKNVGRAKIRNQLADLAHHKYLLFLDGDSAIIRDDYLTKYLQHGINEGVIVGGRVFPENYTLTSQKLHWLSGHFREQKDQSGFQSNNFLLAKELFAAVGGFDESFTTYGHEDTLFGHALHQKGIEIHFIDNPTLHGQLKDAETFLQDQEEALMNLSRIQNYFPGIQTNLLATVRKVNSWGVSSVIKQLFNFSGPFLRRTLTGPNPSLFLLDLYKIGYYFHLDEPNIKR